MKISRRAWNEYIDKLYKCNKGAADAMWHYMKAHGIEDVKALINYGYAVATKYGEASAAIAAEMYDATAALAGASVPAAVPAETATYGEVTAAVKKSAEYSNQNTIANTVARLVKQAGADTTIQNAVRDHAQWAWIPSGDTCAFCIALASRGWQYASKRVMKGDHAQHIHANCDCTFAVRFDEKSSYESYDPKKYEDIYNSAEGSSSKDKINAIRRELYKANGDTIREQKRIAYAEKKARESGKVVANSAKSVATGSVTTEYINAAQPNVGAVTYESGYSKTTHKAEITTAQWLHDNLGGNITLLTEVNEDKVRTPDYLWNGKLWDLKTISSEKAANSAVRHGISQIISNPGGVILDIGENKFDETLLWNVVDKRMGWYKTQGSIDIMLLSKGKLIAVKRY